MKETIQKHASSYSIEMEHKGRVGELIVSGLSCHRGGHWLSPVTCVFPGSTAQAGVSSWSVRRFRVMQIGHYGQ